MSEAEAGEAGWDLLIGNKVHYGRHHFKVVKNGWKVS